MTEPVARTIKSLRVHCPGCHGKQGRHLDDTNRPTDDDIIWTADGKGMCSTCGVQLTAYVGGWYSPLRSTCLGCGKPLEGRAVKWCRTSGLGWEKLCSVAWSNPGLLWGGLLKMQEHTCGICALPLNRDRYEPVEVDHVVPRSAGGALTAANLRATHRDCNQLKKNKSLADARRQLGITPEILAERVAGLGDEARALILSEGLEGELSLAQIDAARSLW